MMKLDIKTLPPMLLILLVFATPLGSSLRSIFTILALVSLVFIPPYNRYLVYTFNTLWGRLALLLFLEIVIACLWSPAPWGMRFALVEKYSKLLYLPIFAVGFSNSKTRFCSINAFLLAMIVTCIVSILKAHHWITMGVIADDPAELFNNHIITGFMIALAAYFSALYAFKYTSKLRVVYSLVFLLMSYQMLFLNTGKTGYLTYAVLMVFFLLQKFAIKKAALGMAILAGIIAIIFTQSTTMQERARLFMQDVHQLQHNNTNNNLGFRLIFHDVAKSLFLKKPIIGTGTGTFKYNYSLRDPIVGWGDVLTDPHSQYWMLLAEQGIIGLGLFILFLAGILWTSFTINESRPIVWGTLLIFCISCFTDTILCFSAAGFLFILITALCFGELVEARMKMEK